LSTVIKVENISKQYRLGDVGTGALAHDVNKWWHKVRGKENPYLKIGESNNRAIKGESDYVWALKDINFDVKQGEVLGIIGRNGAGKSTLLKILSKTTTPTTGCIKIKGRIASLLEVGTGFHPELSGRDNIFLNGAILGMTKHEIRSKFDEIVEFAGVERYIDTPVKRYSSGMYVRLAFGVAAHLEPEILIVDEVLAVGDAEFQKKALGKMKDVSEKDGRTVLFVSHNMAAMKNLCTNGLLLKNGTVSNYGTINETIDSYLENFTDKTSYYEKANSGTSNSIQKIIILNNNDKESSLFNFNEKITIKIIINIPLKYKNIYIGIAVSDKWKKKVFTDIFELSNIENNNSLTVNCTIPENLFCKGFYSLDASLFIPNKDNFDYLCDACSFEIEDLNSKLSIFGNNDIGNVMVNCKWETE
jgi:lipopolysaccharide transport system ATP-binding protein